METPEGIKRMRDVGYPWLNEAADLMEEMAKDLDIITENHSYDEKIHAIKVLNKYSEWK
jgi:hypothetical protein